MRLYGLAGNVLYRHVEANWQHRDDMMALNSFTRHPHSVGETYSAHMHTAATFGVKMIVSGAACVVHAFLPMVFAKTASNTVRALYAQMQGRGAPEQPQPHFLPEYEI